MMWPADAMKADLPEGRPKHFFIIGGQRCGTTSLAGWLGTLPGIQLAQPLHPEPKFYLHPANVSVAAEGYRATLFPNSDGAKLLGEKSTSYIESEPAMERICRAFPDAPIICLIRDPISRALSNALFSTSNGVEQESLEKALVREATGATLPEAPPGISVNPFHYLARSCYVSYLAQARRVFGERLLVVQTEQIGSPACDRRLFEHLQVSAPEFPSRSAAPDPKATHALLTERSLVLLKNFFRPSIEALILTEGEAIDLSLWPTWD